jgi:hypothetical protein
MSEGHFGMGAVALIPLFTLSRRRSRVFTRPARRGHPTAATQGDPINYLRCPIRLRYLRTALSYAPLRSALTSSNVSWVGFRTAIQHIHP